MGELSGCSARFAPLLLFSPFFLRCQLSAAIQVQKIGGVPVERRALVG
jgi:hypothetical protein